MRRGVLLDRARRHYEQRGYVVQVQDSATAGLRADLLVEKNGRRRAVRVDDDPIGTYGIGALAAEAKRAKVQATIVCPGTPDVIAACEQFGVEHISPEGMGEETPIIVAGRRAVTVPTPALEPMPQRAVAALAEPASHGIPAWRRGVVAMIWLLAVVAWTYLLLRIF